MNILSPNKVKLNAIVKDRYEAIRIAGELLVQAGHVEPNYIDSMIEREDSLSTYMVVVLLFRTVQANLRGPLKPQDFLLFSFLKVWTSVRATLRIWSSGLRLLVMIIWIF